MRKSCATLRLRAGEFANSMRRAGSALELEVANRRLHLGDRVHIEVSFGPMADEVNVFGAVQRTIAAGGLNERKVCVQLDADCEDQLRYLEEVLGGGREAAARRHRRIPSSLGVRWDNGIAPQSTRLLDISAGGAFIVSDELPEVGEKVSVHLRTEDILKPLRLDSIVSWIRPVPGQERRGFGVSFKVSNADAASRLGRVVQRHEQAFAGRTP